MEPAQPWRSDAPIRRMTSTRCSRSSRRATAPSTATPTGPPPSSARSGTTSISRATPGLPSTTAGSLVSSTSTGCAAAGCWWTGTSTPSSPAAGSDRCCSTRPRQRARELAGDAPAGEAIWVETAHLVGDPTGAGAPRGPRLHACSAPTTGWSSTSSRDSGAVVARRARACVPSTPSAHARHAQGRARRGVRRRVGPRAARLRRLGRAGRSAVPQFDPELILVVWDGDEIAAIAVNYAEAPRRLGPGSALLGVRPAGAGTASGCRCSRRASAASPSGARRSAALGVDSENPTGATRLYERAGMRILWRADVWRKELRHGVQHACLSSSMRLPDTWERTA